MDEKDLYGEYEELELDEEDAGVLEQFLPSAPRKRKTLADIIMEKINEKNAADAKEEEDGQYVLDTRACSLQPV